MLSKEEVIEIVRVLNDPKNKKETLTQRELYALCMFLVGFARLKSILKEENAQKG